MTIQLPALPYKDDALEPHISKETIGFHYAKHHQGYVKNLNKLVSGTPQEAKSLEEIILEAKTGSVFNNAAQIWNHTFYWESMSAGGGGDPQGKISQAISDSFGSADSFREAFFEAATRHFGSGWVWLIEAGSGLEIITTPNAELPLTAGQRALLTLDVWEHAYYLDYQNLRADYVNRWLENLINWEFAENHLNKAR